jgi:hypothetical protein
LQRNRPKLAGYSPVLQKAITATSAQTAIMATTKIVMIFLCSSFILHEFHSLPTGKNLLRPLPVP